MTDDPKTTHTPGPWAWRWKSGSLHRLGMPPYAFGDTVFCIDDDHSGIDISDADAALIAAAPDLLEALKGVLRVADRKTVEFDAARAAIAKAEHQT